MKKMIKTVVLFVTICTLYYLTICNTEIWLES